MVNLVDAFTKQFGRPPTMKELDAMFALQKDQKKFRELKERVDKKTIYKPQPKGKARAGHSPPLRFCKNAKIVNRMLHKSMSVRFIAYCLDIPMCSVEKYIKEHRLPREI